MSWRRRIFDDEGPIGAAFRVGGRAATSTGLAIIREFYELTHHLCLLYLVGTGPRSMWGFGEQPSSRAVNACPRECSWAPLAPTAQLVAGTILAVPGQRGDRKPAMRGAGRRAATTGGGTKRRASTASFSESSRRFWHAPDRRRAAFRASSSANSAPISAAASLPTGLCGVHGSTLHA